MKLFIFTSANHPEPLYVTKASVAKKEKAETFNIPDIRSILADIAEDTGVEVPEAMVKKACCSMRGDRKEQSRDGYRVEVRCVPKSWKAKDKRKQWDKRAKRPRGGTMKDYAKSILELDLNALLDENDE